MRFEGALDEVIAWHVGRPRLGERAGEGEQDRSSGERNRSSRSTHRPATGIDDEIAGPEEGFDLVEANRMDLAASDHTRRRRRQSPTGPTDLRDQGGDAGRDGGDVGTAEGGGRLGDSDASEREFGAGELGARRERRRQAGRAGVDRGERLLGAREVADEELAAGTDQARVAGVRVIAQRIERPRGRGERAHRRAQVVRDEGDLRLGDLAARPGEALASAKTAGSAPEELARPLVVTELGHGDAAQGESRRIVSQRDALESAQRITGRQRARGCGHGGVHVRQDTYRSRTRLEQQRVIGCPLPVPDDTTDRTDPGLPPTPDLLILLLDENAEVPAPTQTHAPTIAAIPDSLRATIERELAEFLGPMAALICEEHFARAGGPDSPTSLVHLVEAIAQEIRDPAKEAEFRRRVLSNLRGET
jgi:hypothetical protein